MPSLTTGTRLGAYEIVASVGTGGMGEVYRARDSRLNREVALKVLPPSLADDPDMRARFEREAQAVAALNHPNIVTIHSVEEADGVRFLTMELVSGTPLSELIPPAGLPLERLLTLAIQVVEAVSVAHQRHIVHRDMKPANVMVTADQRVKVLDFGLAKLRGPVLQTDATARTAAATEAGRIIGTVSYMSPEQAEGREVDPRTDIFSLGVLLYEMASGRRPFGGASGMATISAILRDTPPSLSDVRRDLPPDFARIVRRCLAKDPARRYQTAVDLKAELEGLKDETVASAVFQGPARPRTRMRRPILVAAIVLVAAGAGFAAWRLTRSDSAPASGAAPLTERQLTTNPLQNPIMVAAVSPDGRYVAYPDVSAIHIRLIETGETRTVPVPEGFCFICASLSWSPDGTRILAAGPAGPAQRDGLWSISTLTGEVRQLLDHATTVRMSPDGARIAFLRGENEVWLMSGTGSDQRLFFSGETDFQVGTSTWSPDSQWFAYLRRDRGAPALTIEARHVSSGEVRSLVPAASLEDPVWTTRGLMYMEHLSVDSHDVWELPLNADAQPAGPPARVTRWNGFIPGSLSPVMDGGRMAMSRQVRQSDVFLIDVDAGGARNERQLTFETRYDVPWAWQGPGELFFVTNRSGSDDIWRQPIGGMAETAVSGPANDRSPQVSPDGKWLLYLSWPIPPPGTAQPPVALMRQPVEGGAAEQVFQSSGRTAGVNYFGWSNSYPAFRCVSGSPRCVVAEEEKDTLVFSTFDPASGEKTRAGQVAVPPRDIAWDLSPDGTRIAFVKWAWDDGHRVTVRALEGGNETEIPIKGWTSLSAVAWAPDGNSLYVISARRNGSSLLRVSARGDVTPLRTETGRWLLNPRPSPDGRSLAFSVMSVDGKVWLVER